MDFKPFKIGKYLLLERLATGGMAEVYRAKASGAGGFEKQLAVKRILPSYSQNEEFRRMFEYEARLSSMLTHSNIVQIYDFVKAGDTYLLAMEYVDGKNLRQFVNKARKVGANLPVEFGVYVINEVCKGLEYAHKKKDDLNGRPLNIIHRDMSPQNIMMSYDGAVKIVDFGIAKAKDRVDETRSGVIKGKFGYMSPEQANGESVDHRTDIFSTGIILWELLTGKRLFAAENDMATLKLIQECVIPHPSRQNPKITPELEKILLKGLTKDLRLRYQDAGLFHRNLQEYLNKYFPSFTQKEAGDVLQRVFREEIEQEKKRFEAIHRQSIPFSQGHKNKGSGLGDMDEIEEALDGEITKSEADSNSAVTFVDNDQEVGIPAELNPEGEGEFTGSGLDSQASEPGSEPGGATQVEPLFVEEEPAQPSQPTQGGKSKVGVPDYLMGNSVTDERTNNSVSKAEKTKVTGEDTLFKESDKMPVINTPTPTGAMGRARGSQSGWSGKSNPSFAKQAAPGQPIILEGDTDKGGTRRRDRSISSVTNLGAKTGTGTGTKTSQSGGIDLVAASDSQTVRASDSFGRAEVGRADYFPEREDYLPKRRSALMSFLLFAGALGGTIYLYQLYLNGKVPQIIRMLSGRVPSANRENITEVKDIPLPAEKTDRRPGGDCTMRIDSDPSGAKIFVEGQERGITGTVLAGPCNQGLDITLRLDGYESVSQNVVLKEKQTKLFQTLRKIPTGTLEIVLNRNANVYIEGNLVREVRAGEKVEIPLRARQKHNLRFVNPILGIDVQKEFFIEEDVVKREVMSLESGPR